MSVDYYANHANKLRFPWSLYHGPLVAHVAREIERSSARRILNVGSGPFLERPLLPSDREYTACDIDPRAVDAVRELYGGAVAAVRIDATAPLPFAEGSFDLVLSCDVIEHIPAADRWLADIVRVVRPGGSILITTPNYGWSTLALIERTVLEVVARRRGYSRADLHPTKLTRRSFERLLVDAGIVAPRIQTISLGWVLFAVGTRPSISTGL
jgi:SAM-dependent methyltransferase